MPNGNGKWSVWISESLRGKVQSLASDMGTTAGDLISTFVQDGLAQEQVIRNEKIKQLRAEIINLQRGLGRPKGLPLDAPKNDSNAPSQKDILDILRRNPKYPTSKMAKELGCTRYKVYKVLHKLRDKGAVKCAGVGANGGFYIA